MAISNMLLARALMSRVRFIDCTVMVYLEAQARLETSELPMAMQRKQLYETLLDWRGFEPVVDDITVMAIRYQKAS